ncbi:MAG: hypothetical protein HFG03_04595 [Oscillibacter sp.]|nr:hypothetical protein [Oscillibacter sp.]
MKQHDGTKPKRRFNLPTIMAVLFYGMFFPLAILLSVLPDSWFTAGGYEDLGEHEFVASQVSSRVERSRRTRRYVIYRAADGSGLEFKMQYLGRLSAKQAVENQETVRRHVYAVLEKPVTRFFFHQFEIQFVPPGTDLQSHLDALRREVLLARWLSLTYSAVYVGASFLRRRKRKKQAVISASPDSTPR